MADRSWPSRILVVTDFSHAAARAVSETATRFPSADLIVLHAIDAGYGARVEQETGLDADQIQDKAYNRADAQLSETVEALRQQGRSVAAALVEGEPVASTLARATQDAVDLIVLGCAGPARGPGGFRVDLMRRSALPVLILPFD